MAGRHRYDPVVGPEGFFLPRDGNERRAAIRRGKAAKLRTGAPVKPPRAVNFSREGEAERRRRQIEAGVLKP